MLQLGIPLVSLSVRYDRFFATEYIRVHDDWAMMIEPLNDSADYHRCYLCRTVRLAVTTLKSLWDFTGRIQV